MTTLISNRYYSKESEAAFLGSLILDPNNIDPASAKLGTDDLYFAEHRLIYDAIKDAWTDHATMDLVVIRDRLKDNQSLDRVGGVDYLVQIANAVPSAASWDYYADTIYKYAIIRRQYLLHSAYLRRLEEPGTIEERLSAAQAVISAAPDLTNHDSLDVLPMAAVEPRDIDWLWPNRIPCGMVSLLVGLPGQGKSFVSLDMAARISTGRPWPDGYVNKPAEVMIFAFEEDLSVATRPRLDAMGADCTKIHAFRAIQLHGITSETIDIHYHLPQIKKYHEANPHIRLIILDPITSALGSADQNSQHEVRHALTLLANFAADTGVAVLGISHFAKRSDTAAVYKTLGSVSFAAVARSVWCVHREPLSEENQCPPRLFLPVKANYSIEAQGLSFDILNGAVEWSSDAVTRSVDEVMRKDKPKRESQYAEVVAFLKSYLADGQEHAATEVIAAAEENGFSQNQVYRSYYEAGVKKRRSEVDKKSYWSLKAPVCQPS